jgi:hypothetical protein
MLNARKMQQNILNAPTNQCKKSEGTRLLHPPDKRAREWCNTPETLKGGGPVGPIPPTTLDISLKSVTTKAQL